ncbi:hypothetical protein N7520_005550 [Penicillium odoratum]|uniref:uncharacterized protein n=1 Tax=Penicillium odoratum TaxID=1167516 RepID=UPI002548446F|nr:uncharacterized protein N7520_005550 [Penicillium odoratum]KAJ5758394.1 hypothetical protein N7520_005550 [Penicillium odoratum]
MDKTPESSPGSPAAFVPPCDVGDAVKMPLLISQLPSGPTSCHLSTNVTNSSESDPPAFLAVENMPRTALGMDVDFPWTLEYTDLFSEGHLTVQDLQLEPGMPLEHQAFSPNAETIQDCSIYTLNSQAPAPAREFGNQVEISSPTCQQQEPRQSRSSTPVHLFTMQVTDDDITMAENFCHVRTRLDCAYEAILAFHDQQSDILHKNLPFPQFSTFNSFIQLYYEHFDDQLPFIHPSLLEQEDTPWILALAVASVGCQYTRVTNRARYASMLTELLRLSLPLDALKSRSYETMTLAQCALLNVVSLMFTGFKDNIVNLQIQRAWLATLMRPFLTTSDSKGSFLSTEVNMVDCFISIFLGMQPIFTAKDHEQTLPSSDDLWKTRNEDTLRSLSLHELFTMNWTSDNALLHSSDFNKMVLYLILFVEERRAIDASHSCALLDFSHDDQTTHPNTRASLSYRTLDWKYEALASTTVPSPPTNTSNSNSWKTIFHLLGIIRHIPLKQLYAYSGWYASEQDIAAAEAYLTGWMRENPTLSRRCVAHAGALLGEIRLAPTTACYHYFCLLIAVLFLWAFERLKRDVVLEQPSQLDSLGTLLKIDQFHDPIVRERWVQGDSGILVHITGVGILSSPGSSQRLLKELLRVLGSRTGWPTLRKGLMVCVSTLLNEATPIEVPMCSD